MNTTTHLVRNLLRKSEMPNSRDGLSWIDKNSVRPVSDQPAKVTVHEALRLWRTRLKTAQAKHQGMPELITELEKLTPQRQIEQYAFDGAGSSATYVFTRSDGRFLGSIVVERKR